MTVLLSPDLFMEEDNPVTRIRCVFKSTVRITTTGLHAYPALLPGKQYRNSRPQIQDMPWGTRDMTSPDPFGNKLIFNERAVPEVWMVIPGIATHVTLLVT